MKFNNIDLEVFALIQKKLTFLLEMKYEVEKLSKEKGTKYGDTLVVKLTSESGVVISINFVLGNIDVTESAYIYIAKNSESISVEDFFEKKLQKNIDFFDNEEKLEKIEFISIVLDRFVDVAERELKKVIMGEEWIDVPMDWHGYK